MIELPKKFERDIQGSLNYLTPLVIIDDNWRMSTTSLKLEGLEYEPLINSLGNIKQSVDVEENKFKISSVTFKIHNIEYNDNRIIDTLFGREIINKPVKIYSKSQTATSIDDCLLIYVGYIKNIKENKDVIQVVVEDKTEQTFDKEIPDHFTNREFLPEKLQDRVIPIVYGVMNKCPLVFDSKISDVTSGEMEARADYHYIRSLFTPKIFNNGVYVRIRPTASTLYDQREGTIYSNLTADQYSYRNQCVIFDRELKPQGGFSIEGVDVDGYEGSPPAFNIIEVEGDEFASYMGGQNKLDYEPDGEESDFTFSAIKSYDDASFNTLNDVNWWSEGNPKTLVDGEGIMLFPLTFGNEYNPYPEDLNDMSLWVFGHTTSIVGYERIYGQNMLSFGGGGFVKSGDILKDITKSDGEKQDFNYYIRLKVGYGECGVLTISGNRNLPIWHTQLTNDSQLFWKVKENAIEQHGDGVNEGSIPYGEHMVVDFPYEKQIDFSGVEDLDSNNSFVLGDRYWDEQTDTFKLDGSNNGFASYFHFKNMRWIRRAVVKDFQDQELFAEVEGRIDNANLRYTSTQDLFTSRQMRSYADRQRTSKDELESSLTQTSGQRQSVGIKRSLSMPKSAITDKKPPKMPKKTGKGY